MISLMSATFRLLKLSYSSSSRSVTFTGATNSIAWEKGKYWWWRQSDGEAPSRTRVGKLPRLPWLHSLLVLSLRPGYPCLRERRVYKWPHLCSTYTNTIHVWVTTWLNTSGVEWGSIHTTYTWPRQTKRYVRKKIPGALINFFQAFVFTSRSLMECMYAFLTSWRCWIATCPVEYIHVGRCYILVSLHDLQWMTPYKG